MDGQNGGQGRDALGKMVAAVPGERATAWVTLQDPKKTYNEAHQMNSVYDKMSGPTRMAGGNKDKGKATDALSAMVVAVLIVWAADLGTETQRNLQVSAGRAEQSISLRTLKDQSTDFKRPDRITDEQDAAYRSIPIERW